MSLLVPNHVTAGSGQNPCPSACRGAYLADGIDATADQLLTFLEELDVSPEVSHLGTASLATLT
jgi:hypothetical protein